MISISSNIAAVRKRLYAYERAQLPYATAQTLNALAFEVRKEVVGPLWTAAFPGKRNAAFPSAVFRVEKATKGKYIARVHNDVAPRTFLDKQAKGGVRIPHGSGSISIPSTTLKPRRGAHGMPQALKPRQVLSNKAFVIHRNGKRLIMRHTKGGGVELLYVLATSATIRKAWPVYESAEAVVRTQFARVFHAQLQRALATAR